MDAMTVMPVYNFSGYSTPPFLPRKVVKYGLCVNIPSVHPVSDMLSKSSKTVVETVTQVGACGGDGVVRDGDS